MKTKEGTNIKIKQNCDGVTVDVYDDFGGESFDLTIDETKTLIELLNNSLVRCLLWIP
jgi:hypothetical protein